MQFIINTIATVYFTQGTLFRGKKRARAKLKV